MVRVAVEAYWTHAVSAEKGTTLASKWLEVDAFPDGLADDKPPELRVLDSNFFSGKPCAHCQALQDSRDEQEQREREVHEVRLHAHVEAERRREGEERQRETERHALMLAARARLAAGTGTGSISFHSSQLIELAPTVSSLSYSTVQSFMYETSKRTVLASTEQNGKFLLHLVVYCNQEFPGHADETQRYGLVVSLEHEDAQIQLYQSVQQTVVTDVRVRTRVRV
ncbi:hypothetical protein [Deinococcus yavapaiensis]|uniref:hypothetical protein n=1 Tax=Deinococcus yavapaiensis TaxID=309889 RepID=UPI0011B645A2|nr:hypothetical protein [Deinococcus yavapaiensis]